MRYLSLSLFTLGVLLVYTSCRTAPAKLPQRLMTDYPPLDRKLARTVTVDSFVLSPAEARGLAGAIYLDARSGEEYRVSHLPEAIRVGFRNPDIDWLHDVPRDTPLVVYCTIGYRSERVRDLLRQRGFTEVYNLYGSLYAWKLAGLPLVDARGRTDRLHTYNRKWGRYVPDTIGIKVY